MPELDYHPAARDEVLRAFQWYDEIDDQVGLKFKLELERAERLVAQSPQSWGPYFHETKGFRFRGFPFVLAYLFEEEKILVLALAHTRRRPGYWKSRV